ncbi:MAG: adenylosuccinate synthetase [Slackia sp.]
MQQACCSTPSIARPASQRQGHYPRKFRRSPQEAKDYVSEIERLSGVKASIISVGPDRDQTFMRGW